MRMNPTRPSIPGDREHDASNHSEHSLVKYPKLGRSQRSLC